jgi:septum formation protein
MPRLILGSGSPRRAALLAEIAVAFEVRVSDIPEVPAPGEPAERFARRIAREKGAAVAATPAAAGAWVLSADTVVVLDDVPLGKPGDAAAARAMLEALSGRSHQVITAVAFTRPDGRLASEIAVCSTVTMRSISAAEIDAYVASGEPFDKAGGYGIQGKAAPFISAVSGSYTNVVGLPVDEVRDELARFGLLPAAAERPRQQ